MSGFPLAQESTPSEAAMGLTGLWRSFKPVIDRSKCVKCLTCVVYCPEDVIDVDEEGYPVINYDYCKGCGICARECPVKAISMERER